MFNRFTHQCEDRYHFSMTIFICKQCNRLLNLIIYKISADDKSNIKYLFTETSRSSAISQKLKDLEAAMKTIVTAKQQLESLLAKKDSKIRNLESSGQRLRRDLADNDARNPHVLKKVLVNKLSKTFTPSQIDRLLEIGKQSQWSEDDIARGITLRSLSGKSYKYLRECLNFPIPSESSLRYWIRNINCEPGIQNSSLRVMKQKSTEMRLQDRVCMLMFDEMSLTEEFCYDQKADRVYGCHSKVQVAMAVGLVGTAWRQPIYYHFDTNIDKDLINSLIIQLEEHGYPVYATCCDMGGSNYGLMGKGQLNVGWREPKKPYFANPFDKHRNVHFFYDVPHLMKLIRNNLIDHEIRTPYGMVSKEPLWELVNYQEGVFKTAYKITQKHLTVSGNERMKVKMAVHLLSNTVGLALEHLKLEGKLKSDQCLATSDLILLSNRWFDVFNVSVPGNSPFTGNLDQMVILITMIEVMKESCIPVWSAKKNCWVDRFFPFQHGIILSSLSLINLFKQLKKEFNIDYLLTRRINQDPLEHLFGVIRQMGGQYDHPNSLSFKYRMRNYIIGKRSALTSSKPNTECADPCRKLCESDKNTVKMFNLFSSPIRPGIAHCSTQDVVSEEPVAVEDLVEPSPSLTGSLMSIMDVTESEETCDFTLPECEQDGFSYVLGFVASKFPALAETRSDLYHVNDWIGKKSRGGLTRMKAELVPQFERLEAIFRDSHGESLNPGKNVLNLLVQEAKKFCHIPDDAMTYYFRCRIFFQVRFLNKKLKNGSKGKSLRKMAKIVS